MNNWKLACSFNMNKMGTALPGARLWHISGLLSLEQLQSRQLLAATMVNRAEASRVDHLGSKANNALILSSWLQKGDRARKCVLRWLLKIHLLGQDLKLLLWKCGVESVVASLRVGKKLKWDSFAHLGKGAVSGVEGTQIHQVRSGGCHIQVKQWCGGDVGRVMASQAGTRPSCSLLIGFLKSNVCFVFLLVPVFSQCCW